MTKNNSKLCAVLSYFLVGIVWYLADEKMKKDALAKYHFKQALNLLVIGVIISVVLSVFGAVFTLATLGIGALLLAPVYLVVNLILLVIWIVGIINAINGKLKPVPIIGQFAEKYLKF